MRYCNLENIINLMTILIFLFCIYVQSRYSAKNSKIIKKNVLKISQVVGNRNAENILRGIYLSLIVLSLILFLIKTKNIYSFNIFPENFKLSLSMVFVSMISVIEMSFFFMVILSKVLKMDYSAIIKQIKLFRVDIDNIFYTGYIKTFIIAVFEVCIFFQILFQMLIFKINIPKFTAMFIVVIIYFSSRFVSSKKAEQGIIEGSLSLVIGLCTIILFNVTNSIFMPILFMYINFVLIAFKDIKVNI